jgi:hypothetical protein
VSKTIVSVRTSGIKATINKIREQVNTNIIYYTEKNSTIKQASYPSSKNQENCFIKYQQHEPLNTKLKTISEIASKINLQEDDIEIKLINSNFLYIKEELEKVGINEITYIYYDL